MSLSICSRFIQTTLVILKKSDQYDSKKLLEEIRITIENKKWFFKDSPVTVSIGLLNEAKNTIFNNEFKAADELFYLAKQNRKNIICHIINNSPVKKNSPVLIRTREVLVIK